MKIITKSNCYKPKTDETELKKTIVMMFSKRKKQKIIQFTQKLNSLKKNYDFFLNEFKNQKSELLCENITLILNDICETYQLLGNTEQELKSLYEYDIFLNTHYEKFNCNRAFHSLSYNYLRQSEIYTIYKNHKKALEYGEKALKVKKKEFSDKDKNTYDNLSLSRFTRFLADIHRRLNNFNEALKYYEEALKLIENAATFNRHGYETYNDEKELLYKRIENIKIK